jgi:glycerol-3-phosphate dehydrogenase
MTAQSEPVDLLIIGGGINGCGIARDAAGRGLSVLLAEQGDLASATSSGSTKLFHGGLRYLEYLEFRLVREALLEREVLLRAMPHISWPLRFVLPLHPEMRFDAETPISRILSRIMPWMRGRRPSWMIRAGLFLYDTMGGRKILPGTRALDLTTAPEGAALKPAFRRAYEYSDCWVEDSRLVVLNARAAVDLGAQVVTQTRVSAAHAQGGLWRVTLTDSLGSRDVMARMLVNAAGPWVGQVVHGLLRLNSAENVRLVRGSHIITRRLFDHDKAISCKAADGRIIFAIPYEGDFTLIGTTDAEHTDPDTPPAAPRPSGTICAISPAGISRKPRDGARCGLVSYSGVRPLYDDGASSPPPPRGTMC